ncbi:MAG: nitronate monooxygenase [Rhodobacterales bacterium]|nr:nitronate monooxygenase [Rhodobacterales bacterium]
MSQPFSTPLSRRLGLRYPLVAAPMFLISNKEMLVACAEAGMMGAIPSWNCRTSEGFEEMLRYVKDKTEKPFAINVTIGLTDPERLYRDVELCVEYEVPVMITSYGNPTEIVKAAHTKNITVFHDVVNLRHAKKAEAAGVDGVIGVSQGAGGHAGEINPYVLVPYLKQHLSTPIIAAGCISTGAHVAAAFSLGAELAYMGTKFIASVECGAQPEYKDMVVNATHRDIVYTNQVSGVNANFLKDTIPAETSPLREDAKRWKDIWSAGQGVSLIDDVPTIEQIVDQVAKEFHDTVGMLGAL